jgi:protein-S-isoprenylcysteine O-methyltransferase Ste14
MTTTRSAGAGVWLAARSLLWTVLLPGAIAGYIPWRFFGLDRSRVDISEPRQATALGLIAIGAALLVACIWEFARRGRGTLAPVDPPRELVVQGLYRYVRNPMYLSVTVIVLGEALLTWSRSILLYWAVWFAWVNAFVLLYEEPALRRQFGASYEAYAMRVGRWIPKMP